jgi:hypothetical protein
MLSVIELPLRLHSCTNLYSVPATGTSNKAVSTQTSQLGSLTICPSHIEVPPSEAKNSKSSESASRLVLEVNVAVHYKADEHSSTTQDEDY